MSETPNVTSNETPRPSILTRFPAWVYVLAVPVLAVIAIAFTGFGSDGGGSPSAASGGNAINIENFEFDPDKLTVKAGDTITVTNRDGAAHTLTADDGSFDTGDLQGDESSEITIDEPGKYSYLCEIHQYMKGTLRVS